MAEQSLTGGRLAVNAAFLKDIKDDNRDLKILFDRIDVLMRTEQAAAHHWPELLQLWADLRDQLALHFGLEEAYGYFDLVDDAHASLNSVALSLKSQHTGLFEAMRHLVETAEKASVGEPSVEGAIPEVTTAQEKVMHRFEAFLNEFKAHEESELKLILDALDEDIGTVD